MKGKTPAFFKFKDDKQALEFKTHVLKAGINMSQALRAMVSKFNSSKSFQEEVVRLVRGPNKAK